MNIEEIREITPISREEAHVWLDEFFKPSGGGGTENLRVVYQTTLTDRQIRFTESWDEM